MMKSPSGIPARVRFATPYLEVESQSTSALERTIKRELAQDRHTRIGPDRGAAISPRLSKQN